MRGEVPDLQVKTVAQIPIRNEKYVNRVCFMMQNEPMNSEIALCPNGSNSLIFAFEFERAELFDHHHNRLDSDGIMSNIYIRQQSDNVKKKSVLLQL